MGGKHKQANRTKNNARPSSSSHSAELLGNTIPTFFGFTAVKDGVSMVPGFSPEELDYSINPEFQIIFKQINKKDPTTRFKALQMFTDLCSTLDVTAVKSILPLWCRTYCALCTDVDHKVRETAHHAHKAVITKVKKMIAPFLKDLAGPWFTSQYDTYAPAASAASLAFGEAFPSTKLNKAIVFCQNEILSYIYDNLINQTPQTLSNPITTSPEDMQAKYERIIIASLQGYSLYLQKVPPQNVHEVEETHKKLLSNKKFWKYSKNKVALIRSCFFHVLIALCQNAKYLLDGESSSLSSAIFNNLDEPDPVVLHAVWDAALNVLVAIEDCWSYINIEKQVFAKLSPILKSGWRNVSTIYPNILPLLSKLPENAIKDKAAFFENFFENMKCGLEVNSFNQTQSEIKIIATTFIECLKYIIMCNSSDIDFCVSLVSKQLISAVKHKLTISNAKKTATMPFLVQTACLVRFWHSNHSIENPAYEKIVDAFFFSLFSSYCEQLDSEITKNSLCIILNNQMEFLTILLNPNKFFPINKGRVKFEKEINEVEESQLDEVESEDFGFSEKLLSFSKKLVSIYFKTTINNEEKSYLPAISKLANLFDSRFIFEEMITAVNESTYFKLFTSYFSKWLMNDEMKCGELVELSFSLLKYVAHDEKEYILEEFCNTWFSDTLQLNICEALSSYSEDDCILKWVRSERFKGSIISLTERFVASDGEDMTSRDIILMLLKAKRTNGGFIIDSTTADSVINILSNTLGNNDDKQHILKLSQDLVLNAKIEQISEKSLETLVSSLFKLWCQKPDNGDLIKACKAGLKVVINNSRKQNKDFQFTEKLSEVIREIILEESLKLEKQIVANINDYIELAIGTNLRDLCSSNKEIEKAVELVKIFLKKDEQLNDKGNKMLEKCCRIGLESKENLDFEYLEAEKYLGMHNKDMVETSEWEEYPALSLDLVKKYANWNLYVGELLNLLAAGHPRSYKISVFLHGLKAYQIEGENESSHEKNELRDIIPLKINKDDEIKLKNDLEVIEKVFHEPEYCEENTLQPLLEEICNFLLSVGLLESFNKYYASTKHFYFLKDSMAELKVIACDLLKNVNFVEYNYIYDYCKSWIRKQSKWWLVRSTFIEIFNRNFVLTKNESSESLNIMKDCFDSFQNVNIVKLPMHRGNFLKILRFLEMGWGHCFSESQWDEIFIFVHNFFEDFNKKSNFLVHELLALSAVSRLFLKLNTMFKENHTKPFEERMPPETCLAWNKVVQMELYNNFVITWRKVAKLCYNQVDISPEWVSILQIISDAVTLGLPLRKSQNLQESVDLVLECGKLMVSSHSVIQITSFLLCLSAIPDIVKLDTEIFGKQMTQIFQDTKENLPLFIKNSNGDWTVKNLQEQIIHNQGIVETLLSDFIVGDCCTVEPFTDSFTYTCSYLLLWCVLLNMCAEAHSPLCFQYGCWLQETGYSKTLLESVFKLMPQTVLHGTEANENCFKYFESYGSLDFREPVKSERIEQVACYVYRLFLQRLPNVVREWWNQSENKTSTLVEKVTRLYVSPILIASELKNVQQDRETGFDNMDVKVYPGSREVVATYTIDEVKMDLVMTLPQNYPLGTIKIESSNVVVSTSNWRNWLFHICKYLIHQNGTIWDALVIWKNNLDKKFEGVEECYICFSILQGSTFETPRLSCHTCKKKFHSNCLYKWFSTSNKSTCPICRNLF